MTKESELLTKISSAEVWLLLHLQKTRLCLRRVASQVRTPLKWPRGRAKEWRPSNNSLGNLMSRSGRIRDLNCQMIFSDLTTWLSLKKHHRTKISREITMMSLTYKTWPTTAFKTTLMKMLAISHRTRKALIWVPLRIFRWASTCQTRFTTRSAAQICIRYSRWAWRIVKE